MFPFTLSRSFGVFIGSDTGGPLISSEAAGLQWRPQPDVNQGCGQRGVAVSCISSLELQEQTSVSGICCKTCFKAKGHVKGFNSVA